MNLRHEPSSVWEQRDARLKAIAAKLALREVPYERPEGYVSHENKPLVRLHRLPKPVLTAAEAREWAALLIGEAEMAEEDAAEAARKPEQTVDFGGGCLDDSRVWP